MPTILGRGNRGRVKTYHGILTCEIFRASWAVCRLFSRWAAKVFDDDARTVGCVSWWGVSTRPGHSFAKRKRKRKRKETPRISAGEVLTSGQSPFSLFGLLCRLLASSETTIVPCRLALSFRIAHRRNQPPTDYCKGAAMSCFFRRGRPFFFFIAWARKLLPRILPSSGQC